MAGIPQNFQAISSVLANYDFVDIASGTGYILFYAGNTVDKYILSNFSYYSDTIYDGQTINSGAGLTLIADLDFDVLLNRPLDVKGVGIVNVPVLMNEANYAQGYVEVYLRKWDGVTETEIVSNTSRYPSAPLGASNVYQMFAVDLDVPLTHFKKGEYIRLTTKFYGIVTSAGYNVAFRIAHDPKSRTSGWDSTGAVVSQLVFQCPVRLNL